MNNSTLRLFGGHCLLGNYEIRPPPKNRRILADRGALSRGIIQFRTRAWKRKSAILPIGCSSSELGAGRSMCRESARPPIPGRRYPISENSPMTSDDGDGDVVTRSRCDVVTRWRLDVVTRWRLDVVTQARPMESAWRASDAGVVSNSRSLRFDSARRAALPSCGG